MTTRTINISLAEQTPQVRTLRFIPRLASVDGDVLLRRPFLVETDEDGDATIALPVKASGSLRYDYEIPGSDGVSRGHFFLSAGSAIDLDDLIAAGGVATDSVIEYVDDAVADAIADIELTGAAGGVLGGTYPNPSFAADMATQAELNAHAAGSDHDGRYYTESEVDTLLTSKAALASPAFTGNPTATTQTFGNSSTRIATTAFVAAAVAAISASVDPGTTPTNATAGSIYYAGADGKVAQDNANLSWDDANNRLGVGVNNSLIGKINAKCGSASEFAIVARLAAAQTADAFSVRDFSDNDLFRIKASGNWELKSPAYGVRFDVRDANGYQSTFDADNGHYSIGNLIQFRWWNPGTLSADIGLARSGPGIIKVTDGSNGAPGGGALEFQERSAPSAPAANNVVLFAQNNGAGKTQLMALFATGAAQQVSIQP